MNHLQTITVGILVFSMVLTAYMEDIVNASDIGVDLKTTRVNIITDENMKVAHAGHIIATVTNYGNSSLYLMVEMKILSAGAMPVEGEFGGETMNIYPTKAVGTTTLSKGDTVDVDVSIGISDINIQNMAYVLSAKVDNGGGYMEIYNSGEKTLPVEVTVNSSNSDNGGSNNWNIFDYNTYILISIIAGICAVIYYIVSIILRVKR